MKAIVPTSIVVRVGLGLNHGSNSHLNPVKRFNAMIPPNNAGHKEPQTQGDSITLGDIVKNVETLKVSDKKDESEKYGHWKGKSEMGAWIVYYFYHKYLPTH